MPFEPNTIADIVQEARSLSGESPWIEFKLNDATTQDEIGEYISALSNTAALFNKNHALMIWGINDATHTIEGTTFDPEKFKKGNQSLALWVSTLLNPQIQFYFHKAEIEGKSIVLLEIVAAYAVPVKFKNVEYVRIDSNKKKLKDFPDTERELWRLLLRKPFETLIAAENVSGETVLRMLNWQAYYKMLDEPPPIEPYILERLLAEQMIVKNETGQYNITNLGAILFARRLSDFPFLERKAIRVILYKGKDRVAATRKEQVGSKGYASGFEGLIDYINGLLPVNEVMGKALRKQVPMYPELAVRELVANTIIHQDFFLSGSSPMVEIFDDRMEITNPGAPLIDEKRFIDHPPLSRNEGLAGFMRRIGVCEERGSGFDKVVTLTEEYQLPAPEIETYHNHTRVILYAHQEFSQMSKANRIYACYLHACLKWVNKGIMTNASLRERFAVNVKNSSMISRILKEACEAGLIKLSEDSTSDRNRRYLPFWA